MAMKSRASTHGPTAGAIILFGLLGVVVVALFARQVSLGREGERAHEALCELSAQYRQSIKSTDIFLNANPSQKIILGVPREFFVKQNDQLKQRLAAIDKDLGSCTS
jgi:hypothetical protein